MFILLLGVFILGAVPFWTPARGSKKAPVSELSFLRQIWTSFEDHFGTHKINCFHCCCFFEGGLSYDLSVNGMCSCKRHGQIDWSCCLPGGIVAQTMSKITTVSQVQEKLCWKSRTSLWYSKYYVQNHERLTGAVKTIVLRKRAGVKRKPNI